MDGTTALIRHIQKLAPVVAISQVSDDAWRVGPSLIVERAGGEWIVWDASNVKLDEFATALEAFAYASGAALPTVLLNVLSCAVAPVAAEAATSLE